MISHASHPPFRRPVPVTITIPYNAYQALLELSNIQGRSLSNLAAYLLESSLPAAESRERGAPRTPSGDGYRRQR
jgi:hypothetical protein